MLDSIMSIFVPVHREGYRFIAIFAAITLVLFWLLPDFFGWIGVILTLWCAYFFRDPPRVTPLDPSLVISPADGRISAIEQVAVPAREAGVLAAVDVRDRVERTRAQLPEQVRQSCAELWAALEGLLARAREGP